MSCADDLDGEFKRKLSGVEHIENQLLLHSYIIIYRVKISQNYGYHQSINLKQCRFKAIEINAAEWYPPAW
jgi:hypothetical protein